MLLATSKGSAASILNINLSPADGGASTQVSWQFGGDIVSASGAELSTPSYYSYPTVVADGVFSDSFKATVIDRIPLYYDLSGGGSMSLLDGPPNDGLPWSGDNFPYTIGSISFVSTTIYGPWGIDPISGWPTHPVLGSTDVLGLTIPPPSVWLNRDYSGKHVFYTAGIDTSVIPVAFSSFNLGSYVNDVGTTPYVSGFSTVVTVVPEPSTYALFGLGAMGILIVLRKKKTA